MYLFIYFSFLFGFIKGPYPLRGEGVYTRETHTVGVYLGKLSENVSDKLTIKSPGDETSTGG